MSFRCFEKNAKTVVQDYLKLFPFWRRTTSLVDDSSFTVLDIETTGFDSWTDKIVSIAWIKVVHCEILVESAKAEIVYQPNVNLKDSSEIHGILSDQVQQGRALEYLLAELLEDLSDSIIVGHHIDFDICMLNQSLRKFHGVKLKNRSLDTAALAMETFDVFKKVGYAGQKPPTLDEVCTYCELEIPGRHTAEGDVLATAQLLLVMLSRLQARRSHPLLLKQLPLKRPQ